MSSHLFSGAAPSSPPVPSSLGSRSPELKAPSAFRTISEVADNLDVPQHVLRFWESKFQQIRPLKRGGGRRYYRPEDVALLNNIKDLLYTQGMTIRGVQKLLREGQRPQFARPPASLSALDVAQGQPQPAAAIFAPTAQPTQHGGLAVQKRQQLESVLAELKNMRELLRQSGI